MSHQDQLNQRISEIRRTIDRQHKIIKEVQDDIKELEAQLILVRAQQHCSHQNNFAVTNAQGNKCYVCPDCKLLFSLFREPKS